MGPERLRCDIVHFMLLLERIEFFQNSSRLMHETDIEQQRVIMYKCCGKRLFVETTDPTKPNERCVRLEL